MSTRLLLHLLVLAALSGCVRRLAAMTPEMEATPEPPPGKVELNLVSERPGQRWDVIVGDELVCTTPCLRQVGVAEGVLLRAGNGDAAYIPGLIAEAPDARRALVVAEGTNRALRVNGIVFTTLGGMAVVTGLTLTAVGCSNIERRPGTCTAGLVTGGIGTAMVATFVWLLVESGPRAHILPVLRSQPAAGQTPVTLVVTPAGLAGTF